MRPNETTGLLEKNKNETSGGELTVETSSRIAKRLLKSIVAYSLSNAISYAGLFASISMMSKLISRKSNSSCSDWVNGHDRGVWFVYDFSG